MKKTLKFTLALALILSCGACASKPSSDANGEGTDQVAATDAGTDAVPQPGAEGADASNPPPPVADVGGTPPPAADLATTPQAPVTDAPPPAATAVADVTQPSPAGTGQMEDYKVQVGDTLMKVAFETYGDLYRWKGILEANRDKVQDPNHIPAGTVLKLERPSSPAAVEKNGEKYMIKTGDTLGTISKDVYGTPAKWKTLYENNKQLIHDPNRIFAGFFLYYQPDTNSPKGDTPSVTPAPMASGAGGTPTATTTGDSARAPASADAPPPSN